MGRYKRGYATLIVTFVGFLAATAVFSAEPTAGEMTGKKEVGQEMREAAEAIKSYSAGQRDEAVKKGKTLLDDLDLRIERMKSKIGQNWDRMDASARKKATASLEAIQKQRVEVAEWYGSLKQSSAGAWEGVKKGFVESYQSLHDTFDQAAEKF
jgi:hypothetical protein